MPSDADAIRLSLETPDAFVTIFDRHYDRVFRFLSRLAESEAADLASETFTQAFRRRARYDLARRDAAPWLFGIAMNLARGHHRGEARRYRAYGRAAAREIDESETDAAIGRMDADLHHARLVSALGALPLRERDVLLLFAWADLGYEEIATALGIPIGTVRSRLSRGRERMRRELDGTRPPTPTAEEVHDG